MGKHEIINSNKEKIQRIIILVISILIIIVSLGIGIYYFLELENESKVVEKSLVKNDNDKDSDIDSSKREDSINDEDILKENGNSNSGKQKKIVVDIKGQVVKPGIYEVNLETRVIDVINLAGGLQSNADTSLINLSKKVFDEMVIIVNSKEEVLNSKTNQKVVDDAFNNASVNDNSSSNIGNYKVNINTATLDILTTLSGIGEAKAMDIINYRIENGGFKTIEDIMNVSGIGESLFAKIKENITV